MRWDGVPGNRNVEPSSGTKRSFKPGPSKTGLAFKKSAVLKCLPGGPGRKRFVDAPQVQRIWTLRGQTSVLLQRAASHQKIFILANTVAFELDPLTRTDHQHNFRSQRNSFLFCSFLTHYPFFDL